MKITAICALFIGAYSQAAYAQDNQGSFVPFTPKFVQVDPSGRCALFSAPVFSYGSNTWFTCVNFAWVAIGGGSATLPTATAAGQTIVSTAPGQNYTAQSVLSQISTGSIASLPSCSTGFLYLPTDSAYNQVASSGDGNCHYFLTGREMFPVNATTYPSSWQLQNGANEDLSTGTSFLRIFDNTSCCTWTGKTRSLPHAAPYTFTVIQSLNLVMGGGTAPNQVAGIGITDGTKQIHIEVIAGGSAFCNIRTVHMTTLTDGGTQVASATMIGPASCSGQPVGLQIQDSGSALTFRYSLDGGVTWIQLGSTEGSTAFLTATNIWYGGTSNTSGATPFMDVNALSLKFQ